MTPQVAVVCWFKYTYYHDLRACVFASQTLLLNSKDQRMFLAASCCPPVKLVAQIFPCDQNYKLFVGETAYVETHEFQLGRESLRGKK